MLADWSPAPPAAAAVDGDDDEADDDDEPDEPPPPVDEPLKTPSCDDACPPAIANEAKLAFWKLPDSTSFLTFNYSQFINFTQ